MVQLPVENINPQASWLYGQFGPSETPVPRPRVLPDAAVEEGVIRSQVMGEMNEIRNRLASLETENEVSRNENRS